MKTFAKSMQTVACTLVLSAGPAAYAQGVDAFSAAVQGVLDSGQHPLLRDGDFTRDRDTLRQVYAQRQSQPVWLPNREPSRQAVQLLQALRDADRYGLSPGDYDGTTLAYRVIDFVTDRGGAALRHAELDVGLSIAAVRFVRHLHYGRVDPRAAGFRLTMPRAPFRLDAALERLASGDDFAAALAEVEPTFLHFQLMKQALQRYRLLAVDPDLTKLPNLTTRSIKPGESYDGVPQLRRLLIALGDLPSDAVTSDVELDETLADGIRRFQQRHGLATDGVLGRLTYAELTTPLSIRAEQLALTMERWRWLPDLTTPPIIVNIPQFRLLAFMDLDPTDDMLQTDVIVGRTVPALRTPAFTAELKYVVFRPYWDVPSSILRNELLPEIRRDLSYLDKHNYEMVSATVAGAPSVTPSAQAIADLEAGTLRLRQRPGDNNALGLVKLMLPNPHNVYLHSTPAQRLFEQARRTFSHGCIRVSNVIGLVEHVLRGEPGDWTYEKIEAAMRDDSPTGNNRHVFLSNPIPVLIVYGTAVASADGQVRFFEDIYEHDAKLKQLLRAGGARN